MMSIHLFVCPSVCRRKPAAAGLLLWAWWTGDIGQLLHGQHLEAVACSG